LTNDEYRAAQSTLGLTNKQLAEKLGVTQDTIVKRKSGRTPITTEAAIAIKKLLGDSNENSSN